jgi:hypothetical protein
MNPPERVIHTLVERSGSGGFGTDLPPRVVTPWPLAGRRAGVCRWRRARARRLR